MRCLYSRIGPPILTSFSPVQCLISLLLLASSKSLSARPHGQCLFMSILALSQIQKVNPHANFQGALPIQDTRRILYFPSCVPPVPPALATSNVIYNSSPEISAPPWAYLVTAKLWKLFHIDIWG